MSLKLELFTQLNDTTTELERLQEKVAQDRCVLIRSSTSARFIWWLVINFMALFASIVPATTIMNVYLYNL